MIRGLALDFDGVLLDTAGLKGEAFVGLFAGCAEAVRAAALEHHYRTLGVNRRTKIARFLCEVLAEPAEDGRLDELEARFGERVRERLADAPWLAGAEEFLRTPSPYPLFIVSAAPAAEVSAFLEGQGVRGRFQAICGPDRDKSDWLRGIVRDLGAAPSEVVFVGDTLSDLAAAGQAGTGFIGVRGAAGRDPFPAGTAVIRDLRDLPQALERLAGDGARPA